jgi:hypothetical protein
MRSGCITQASKTGGSNKQKIMEKWLKCLLSPNTKTYKF